MRPLRHPLARLASLAAGLATALGGVGATGARLPSPPLTTSMVRWCDWSTEVGPAGTVMGLVRGITLVGLVYLLGIVTAEIVGRASGVAGVLRAVRRVTLPGLAPLVQRVAGAGLAVSVVAGAAMAPRPVGATPPASAPIVMTVLDHQPPSTVPPVMHLVDSDPPPATPAPAPAIPTAPPIPVPAPSPPAAAPRQAVWVIRPGDHLWHVADETLARSFGHPPTSTEVAAYVQALIMANRQVFVVANDANLVYPGQRFALPPVPSG